jgi:hypothetical protein
VFDIDGEFSSSVSGLTLLVTNGVAGTRSVRIVARGLWHVSRLATVCGVECNFLKGAR